MISSYSNNIQQNSQMKESFQPQCSNCSKPNQKIAKSSAKAKSNKNSNHFYTLEEYRDKLNEVKKVIIDQSIY